MDLFLLSFDRKTLPGGSPISENLFHENVRNYMHCHLICIKCAYYHEKGRVLCKLVAFFEFSCIFTPPG